MNGGIRRCQKPLGPNFGRKLVLKQGDDEAEVHEYLRIAAEPPCITASGPYLSPGYGFGPLATIWRNRGAEHRPLRKYVGANGIRSNLCDAAAR